MAPIDVKQLHLANIANVAYIYARILREVGAPPYDPYTTRMAHPYDGEHLFRIDRTRFLPLMTQTGFREAGILALELPYRQLFMSFEKPALESWRACGS
jgi:hypothetical protein